jgi:hypothetical protein
MWKIKNISKAPVKLAAAKSNQVTIGMILKPGEFCVCDSRMTASIDAQERRNFISVDRNFSNDLKLKLCQVYAESTIAKAEQQTDDYAKS